MNPIRFRGQNAILGQDQPGYLPLPAHYGDTPFFVVTTCWRPTWLDLLRIIFSRRVWSQQLTFGERAHPQLLFARQPDFLAQPDTETRRSAAIEEEE